MQDISSKISRKTPLKRKTKKVFASNLLQSIYKMNV